MCRRALHLGTSRGDCICEENDGAIINRGMGRPGECGF